MAIWSAGLAMRASAERATKWGGGACLLEAARITIGNIAILTVADKPFGNAVAWFIGASIFPMILVEAGLHLRRGKGWVWGSLASFLLALDVALFTPEPASIYAISSVIVKVALLTLMINGARGAFALQKVDYSKTYAPPSAN